MRLRIHVTEAVSCTLTPRTVTVRGAGMGDSEAGERHVTEVGETSCSVHTLPPRSTTGSANAPWRPEPVEGELVILTGRLGKHSPTGLNY